MLKDREDRLRTELSSDSNVLLAYLFGSAVRGRWWIGSDVDVALLLRDNSWERISELMDRIAEALDLSVDKIDLVDLSGADEVLKYQVINEGHMLVDKGLEQFIADLYTNIFDTLRFLDFYRMNSINPLRKEILERKLMSLDEEIDILRRYILSMRVEQVAEDEIAKRVLRDSLRVGIEAAIDICKHVAASKKLGMIRDYNDFPLKLAERDLMRRELAEALADFAKLRNIIVHRYIELDYELLYEKAKGLLEFEPAFRQQIMELIELTETES